ncbi:hypothetical protein [Aeromonas eucrenophila]|uniref:Uncharacterized protein n=1 Tax=Aeromonas eucrenophila TaxID=649 RepID=A0ABW0YH50_9GAMM|nr:hypothetical protein [Aeromonas eucrenophila]
MKLRQRLPLNTRSLTSDPLQRLIHQETSGMAKSELNSGNARH